VRSGSAARIRLPRPYAEHPREVGKRRTNPAAVREYPRKVEERRAHLAAKFDVEHPRAVEERRAHPAASSTSSTRVRSRSAAHPAGGVASRARARRVRSTVIRGASRPRSLRKPSPTDSSGTGGARGAIENWAGGGEGAPGFHLGHLGGEGRGDPGLPSKRLHWQWGWAPSVERRGGKGSSRQAGLGHRGAQFPAGRNRRIRPCNGFWMPCRHTWTQTS